MGPAAKWVVGLMVFSAFFVGFAGFIGEVATNYEVDAGTSFTDVSSAFENVINDSSISTLQSEYNQSSGEWENPSDVSGFTALSWPGHIYKTFAAVISALFGVEQVSREMIGEVGVATNLNPAIMNIIITIAVFCLLFIVVRAMTGRDL
jgi:hypothetical protein